LRKYAAERSLDKASDSRVTVGVQVDSVDRQAARRLAEVD
jgi:hypothetical protein